MSVRSYKVMIVCILIVAFSLGVVAGRQGKLENHAGAAASRRNPRPRVVAGNPVDAGRYLVAIAACNDCHTAGYDESGGKVPESQWLLGSPIGWRGPWGTSYAQNIRLTAGQMPREAFIAMMRGRTSNPPMPWPSMHAMHDEDLAAIWAYLQHLGPAGELMPVFVAPGVEPQTPYYQMSPQEPMPVEETR